VLAAAAAAAKSIRFVQNPRRQINDFPATPRRQNSLPGKKLTRRTTMNHKLNVSTSGKSGSAGVDNMFGRLFENGLVYDIIANFLFHGHASMPSSIQFFTRNEGLPQDSSARCQTLFEKRQFVIVPWWM
jgi:hypothetical protein